MSFQPILVFHSLIVALFLLPSTVYGGNGPHNWLVVYDPSDPHGVAMTRHYQEARSVPESNLVAWNFPKGSATSPSLKATISAAEAWELIEHIRTTIDERGISDQIHGILIAGNAPIGVRLTVFLNGADASMTTWLAFSRDATDQIDLELRVQQNNNAFRDLRLSGAPPIEMRSDKEFSGEWLGDPTIRRYYMAQHLGFTGIMGNRLDEILTMIDRSVAADGRAPDGTIYWPLNPNLRSRLRANQAYGQEPEWEAMGVDFEVFGQEFGGGAFLVPENKRGAPGSEPANQRAVRGAIVGKEAFSIFENPSIYLPGSIAEHLTSFGGQIGGSTTFGQTKIPEWIRAGASGTSGTIVEPGATFDRFPNARIHTLYEQGNTLGEAFFLSIENPFFTLVIGDPLTQPYAEIPELIPEGLNDGQTVSGSVVVNYTATSPSPLEAETDLVVDGRVVAVGNTLDPVIATRTANGFQIDTSSLTEGWHEIRVVAYEASKVRTQGFAAINVKVDNHAGEVALSGPSTVDYEANHAFTASVSGIDGVASVEIRTLGRVLATLPASGGSASIPGRALSHLGTNQIFAVAVLNNGQRAWSDPLLVEANWSPLPAQPQVPTIPGQVAWARIFKDVQAGGFDWNTSAPQAVVPVDNRFAVLVEQSDQWPGFEGVAHQSGETAGVEFVTRWFARETGVYDFLLEGQRDMGLLIDGQEIQPVTNGWPVLFSAAVERGWHEVRLRSRVGTFSNKNLMPFQPMFRAGYTERFHWQGHPVEEYETFTLDHCAASLAKPSGAAAPLPAARATGVGSVQLDWNDPFEGELGWRAERFLGFPEVTLVEYLGAATAPEIVAGDAPDAFGPGARVANDESSDRFTFVQPYMRGPRLLTARADAANDGQSTLYRVSVPAGTKIFAIVNGNGATPPWMSAQGGWTQFSRPNQPGKGSQVESHATPLWTVFTKTFDSAQVVHLGGAESPTNLIDAAQAITFAFVREAGHWETVGTAPADADSLTVSGLPAGPGQFRLAAEFGNEIVVPSAAVSVDLVTGESNAAPAVTAGPDIIVPLMGSMIALKGMVTDDDPASLTTTWAQISGPGTAAFNDVNDPATTVTFSAVGTYELSLSANDGARTTEDFVAIEVTATGNAAPAVDVGDDITLSLLDTLVLDPIVTDDGLPFRPDETLLYRWNVISGPTIPAFQDTAIRDPDVVFIEAGTYELELEVDDGAATGRDSLIVVVEPTPANAPPQLTVTSGPAVETSVGVAVTLTAQATDDGVPGGDLNYIWREFSGSANITASPWTEFTTPNQASTDVTFEQPGEYYLMISVNDGGKTTYQLVKVTVELNDDGNAAPTVVLGETLPVIFTELSLIDVAVSDDGLPDPPASLSTTWTKLSGPGEVFVTLVENGTKAQVAASEPGEYELELHVSDGTKSATDTTSITVEDRAKYGIIWAWGSNSAGNAGPFNVKDLMDGPRPIGHGWPTMRPGTTVSFGVGRSGELLASGGFATGSINTSVLGEFPTEGRSRFAPIPALPPVQHVAHAVETVAVLTTNDEVWSWGYHFYGALGYPATDIQRTPKRIDGFENVARIFGGNRSMIAVKDDGSVWVWGYNHSGKLGLGNSTTPVNEPTLVSGVTDVTSAVSASIATLLLRADGTALTSGDNFYGQLGNGTSGTDRYTFDNVLVGLGTPLTNILEIAAGNGHFLALDEMGYVWAWGQNSQGQLGVGDDDARHFATRVEDPDDPSGYLSDVIDIAATNSASFAVKSDGSVVGWGWKFSNVFGNERPAADRVFPGPVTGLPPVERIWGGGQTLFASTPFGSYQDYVAEQFTEAEIQAGLADPELVLPGNRLSNLLNYALGRHPRDQSPPLQLRLDGSQLAAEASFLTTLGDVAAGFETSSNLKDWDPVQPQSEDLVFEGDKANATLRFDPEDSERLFIRLKILGTADGSPEE